jgi:hypothetical protein
MSKTPAAEGNALKESVISPDSDAHHMGMAGIDITLLEHSLSLTPWERMLANDDALNFAESLRSAMGRRHAKP